MQREAVHLSFGWANYVATHFWNAQQSYFDYSRDAPEPIVEHDVSFIAGRGVGGVETYSPRALLFDLRNEFGSLRQISALYGGLEQDEMRQSWSGEVHAQQAIAPSWYASVLEKEDAGEEWDDQEQDQEDHTQDHAPRPERTGTGAETATTADANLQKNATAHRHGRAIEYWSDYSRVFFHPRSLVHVASPSLSGTTFMQPMGSDVLQFSSYEQGHQVAVCMEHDQSVMDDNLRWLAEDSDLLQGFHIATSSFDGFSGYSNWYLSELAEEFPKTPRIAFAFSRAVRWENSSLQRISQMNNALALAAMAENALVVPVSPHGPVGPHATVDWTNAHQAAAVLAAHIETATLPTRLRDAKRDTLGSVIGQLNWRRDTPVAVLGGCMPMPLLAPVVQQSAADVLLEQYFAARAGRRKVEASAAPTPVDITPAWHEFSNGRGGAPYSSYAVGRDSDALAEGPTKAALDARCKEQYPHSTIRFAPLAFNIESSFPQIFHGLTRDGRALPQAQSKVRSVPMASALSTSPGTLHVLEEARKMATWVAAMD
ncbi:mtDNA inheritance, partitioning of the mitochondrial organelle [Malassezia cuniculi]|uniref:MtDNA inheritance, partitioning of the mitochondrial organelle n=1 Tax=Malassezia cuniculi TaxID=948313 RepID=A0AAF0EQJ4_9BASI|nr:mtDNA inheritance, partitioning of the mitochondrial organelle [Malassezia cuniculi]